MSDQKRGMSIDELDEAMKGGMAIIAKSIEDESGVPVEPCVVRSFPAAIVEAVDRAKARQTGDQPPIKSGAVVLVASPDGDDRAFVVYDVSDELERLLSGKTATE